MAKYSLKTAKRYARALFESCEVSELDRVQGALEKANEVFSTSATLQDALSNPAYPIQQRLDVIDAVCQSNGINEVKVANTMKLLTEHKALSNLSAVTEIFKKLIEALRKELSVEISSAFEISAEEMSGMKDAFQKVSGGLATIESKIDKKLIGGLKVRVGDRVLDNSIEGALNRFSEVI